MQDQLRRLYKTANDLRNAAGVTALTNWITNEDNLIQALETDWGAEVLRGLGAQRASLSDVFVGVTQTSGGLWRTYGQQQGYPDAAVSAILAGDNRLYDRFADNALRVTSRQVTYPAFAVVGVATGDGILNRLTTSYRNFAIENCFVETTTARCIEDTMSGRPSGQELFEFRGEDAEKDGLRVTGSGKVAYIAAKNGADSARYIQNPSWGSATATMVAGLGTPTDLPGWTPFTLALSDLRVDQNNTYRTYRGEGTAQALQFRLSGGIRQTFTTRSVRFDPLTPYYVQVAWNRSIGGGSGTITLRFGAASVSVVAAAQVGWQVLRIAIGQNNWYRQFNATSFDVEIEVTGFAGTHILFDDLVVSPFEKMPNGLWVCPVGGATAWLRGDTYNAADTEIGSILQYWIWRDTTYDLPHTIGAGVTWLEP